MKQPKAQGTWETHPCVLPPLLPHPSAIGAVWRCNCGRRWRVEDMSWEERTESWIGDWAEQEPRLDDVDFQQLEQHANVRTTRRWRHR